MSIRSCLIDRVQSEGINVVVWEAEDLLESLNTLWNYGDAEERSKVSQIRSEVLSALDAVRKMRVTAAYKAEQARVEASDR